MLLPLTIAAVILLFCLFSFLSAGTLATTSALVITSTILLPLPLVAAADTFHVGIAGPSPELRTFSVVMALAAIAALLRYGQAVVPLSYLAFSLWVLAGWALFWADGPTLRAGILQLSIGLCAWITGAGVARAPRTAAREHILVLLLLSVIGVQVLVCFLQLVGLPVNRLDISDASILGTRVNGTANHPNNLGKILLCLLVLLLPLTESLRSRTRQLALIGVIVMLLPLGLAQGRANMAAYICAIGLWTLLSQSGRHVGRKLVLFVASVGGIGAFATAFLARFEEDPEGGVRSQILQIALRAMPEHRVFGVGPNNYVDEVASRFGSYIPVHNTFVLLALEVGLIGGVLFMLPIARAVVRSARFARRDPYARALLAVSPGLLAVGWTGWGLLGTSVLPLLMYSVSYTNTRSRQGTEIAQPPLEETMPAISSGQVKSGSARPVKL